MQALKCSTRTDSRSEPTSVASTRRRRAAVIAREERFGGGTIVVPAHEADEQDGAWSLPYGELSMCEAPPYSPNVDLHAYFEFWERLGTSNTNVSIAAYMPSGNGPVQSEVEVPDDRCRRR